VRIDDRYPIAPPINSYLHDNVRLERFVNDLFTKFKTRKIAFIFAVYFYIRRAKSRYGFTAKVMEDIKASNEWQRITVALESLRAIKSALLLAQTETVHDGKTI